MVDDDDISNFLTQSRLQEINACESISVCMNGKEAMAFLNACQGDYPSLVLLDINMPLVNGFEFLDWYGASEHTGKFKICMFTTSIQPEDQKRSQTYPDVIGYMEKPLDAGKLTEVLMYL